MPKRCLDRSDKRLAIHFFFWTLDAGIDDGVDEADKGHLASFGIQQQSETASLNLEVKNLFWGSLRVFCYVALVRGLRGCANFSCMAAAGRVLNR